MKKRKKVSRRTQGLKIIRKMGGAEGARDFLGQVRALSPEFERLVVEFLAGELWSRPHLDLRTRSLCTIAALAALGRNRGLAWNVQMAIGNGATREEICEVLLHLAGYAGFPAAWEGLQVAHETLEKIPARLSR